MTSLEFIEKEIENIKEFLSDSVDVIGKNTKDSDFWEQRLHHLQQVKTILEAWEIAKAKEIDLYDVITSQDVEEFNCDLVKAYQLTDYEFKTLRKALEVK